jgi:hypothetical protein
MFMGAILGAGGGQLQAGQHLKGIARHWLSAQVPLQSKAALFGQGGQAQNRRPDAQGQDGIRRTAIKPLSGWPVGQPHPPELILIFKNIQTTALIAFPAHQVHVKTSFRFAGAVSVKTLTFPPPWSVSASKNTATCTEKNLTFDAEIFVFFRMTPLSNQPSAKSLKTLKIF